MRKDYYEENTGVFLFGIYDTVKRTDSDPARTHLHTGRLRPHENPNASVRQAGRADEFTGLTEGYVGALPQTPEGT